MKLTRAVSSTGRKLLRPKRPLSLFLVTDHRLPEPVARWLIARLARQTPEQRVRTVRIFVVGVWAAGALMLFIIVGQYIDSRLMIALKWPQFFLYGGMAVVLPASSHRSGKTGTTTRSRSSSS